MARKISEHTSGTPTSATVLIGNIGANTRKFSFQDTIDGIIAAAGDLLMGAGAGNSTILPIGSSGTVLHSTGGVAAWVAPTNFDPSTGHITTAGTSGQVLQTTAGAAAWVDSNTLTGTITTAGTSGQVLQTTGGAATWKDQSDLTGVPGTITTAGTSGQVLQTTGGAAAWRDSTTLPGSLPSTVGTSGQILQTTGGVAAWVGSTTVPAATPSSVTDIGCRIFNNTTQAVTADTWASLSFNSERWDTDGLHSTAANSSLITISTSGKYLIAGCVGFTSGGANDISIRILLNSTTPLAAQTHRVTAATPEVRFNVSAIHDLTSGHTLELQYKTQSSGNQLTTAVADSQEFMVQKIA